MVPVCDACRSWRKAVGRGWNLVLARAERIGDALRMAGMVVVEWRVGGRIVLLMEMELGGRTERGVLEDEGCVGEVCVEVWGLCDVKAGLTLTALE
jgi:hypothetical protein